MAKGCEGLSDALSVILLERIEAFAIFPTPYWGCPTTYILKLSHV